jgi:hypothetical protein
MLNRPAQQFQHPSTSLDKVKHAVKHQELPTDENMHKAKAGEVSNTVRSQVSAADQGASAMGGGEFDTSPGPRGAENPAIRTVGAAATNTGQQGDNIHDNRQVPGTTPNQAMDK